MESYTICPKTAEQAARDYLAIRAAGMLPALHYEIREAVAYVNSLRWDKYGRINPAQEPLDGFRVCDGWYLRGIKQAAGELAGMLECPAEAVEPHIFDGLWNGPTRRRITLDCLASVASKARKQLAAERQQAARRRSA